MKKYLALFAALSLMAAAFTACFSATVKQADTPTTQAAETTSVAAEWTTIPDTAADTDEIKADEKSEAATLAATTQKNTVQAIAPQESQTNTPAESEQIPTTGHPAMKTDTFVITKVSGTYLELKKKVYGENTDTGVYCCDLGIFDGSADMNYAVGDEITLRYDYDVAETYPMQLTVREIL